MNAVKIIGGRFFTFLIIRKSPIFCQAKPHFLREFAHFLLTTSHINANSLYFQQLLGIQDTLLVPAVSSEHTAERNPIRFEYPLPRGV